MNKKTQYNSGCAQQHHLRLYCVLFGLMACLPTGCATYQFGNQSLYRPDIRTVHVPIVRSSSFRRNLGERLTEAIVKELERSTPYKVVSSVNADSILDVHLITDRKHILGENRFDEPRDIEAEMHVEILWRNRAGQPLLTRQPLPMQANPVLISGAASFVPEGGQSLATAQQSAIDDLARQIVGQMEVPW